MSVTWQEINKGEFMSKKLLFIVCVFVVLQLLRVAAVRLRQPRRRLKKYGNGTSRGTDRCCRKNRRNGETGRNCRNRTV